MLHLQTKMWKQEDYDGPILLIWANKLAYLF